MKQHPLVTQLNLYDIVHTPGVAADLSHIDTKSNVKGFCGADQLDAALKGKWPFNMHNDWPELIQSIYLFITYHMRLNFALGFVIS